MFSGKHYNLYASNNNILIYGQITTTGEKAHQHNRNWTAQIIFGHHLVCSFKAFLMNDPDEIVLTITLMTGNQCGLSISARYTPRAIYARNIIMTSQLDMK